MRSIALLLILAVSFTIKGQQHNHSTIFKETVSPTVEGRDDEQINIHIVNNLRQISDIPDLPTLVSGDLLISNNTEIESLAFLASVKQVNGDVVISNNTKLIDLNSLTGIKINGKLIIEKNSQITTLNLEIKGGNLIQNLAIRDNPQLVTIGLSGDLSGGIYIDGNPNLTSIQLHEELETIEGSIRIGFNPNLSNVVGLNRVKSIKNDLVIHNNKALLSLDAFQRLSFIGRDLAIEGNSILEQEEISEFGLLKDIGRHLKIRQNDAIANLDFLSALETVNGEVAINDNENLLSIEGLNNVLIDSPNSLSILNNERLSICNTYFVCNYLNGRTAKEYEIGGNDEGCQTASEILLQCQQATVEALNRLVIFPNPSDEFIAIASPITAADRSIRILRVDGTEVFNCHSCNHQRLDISSFTPGVYTLVVSSKQDNQLFTAQFVKK